MYLQKGENKVEKTEEKQLVAEIQANTFGGFVFKHPVYFFGSSLSS